eukprot:5009324-Pyramimonas_sp.AAC.1
MTTTALVAAAETCTRAVIILGRSAAIRNVAPTGLPQPCQRRSIGQHTNHGRPNRDRKPRRHLRPKGPDKFRRRR